jgi:hypothetical protein
MELEERLAGTKSKIDLLQHEMNRLKREVPGKSRDGPR